jgi:hypothetical protein
MPGEATAHCLYPAGEDKMLKLIYDYKIFLAVIL